MKWTIKNIPSQKGRIAVITGAGGIGYETALEMARAGASVILAGRSEPKGETAITAIKAAIPGADVKFGVVDLASLSSIQTFASWLSKEHERVDILVNNAGVMTPPERRQTADGFELQLGTNYLGHFALTGRLLPLLQKARARVVSLGSVAARDGAINIDDLQAERGYKPMTVYSQSKLACVMFALELSRRSAAGGWGITSLAAHPGISRTDLLPNGAGKSSLQAMARRYLWFLFQPASQGALPTLFAATDPSAKDGAYYGPDGIGELRGAPKEVQLPKQALNGEVAARLWAASEQLTKVTFA
jgi:NAD(P)-dependent dehydrogenase (short-subunit alcohol dehydrogenase family)